MSNRPLQVYLDSSDYSRFADVYRGRGDARDEITFKRLLELKQQNGVQFPYSSMHICEAMARDATAIDAATARLHVMCLLSDKNVFRAWTELPSFDVFSVSIAGESAEVKPVNRSRFHGRSDIGEWFPDSPAQFSEIAAIVRGMYSPPLKSLSNESVLTDGNRQARRAAKAKRKSASYSSGLQNQIRANWSTTFPQMCASLPIRPEDSTLWRRFVASPTPDPVPAYLSFIDGISDSSILARFFIPATSGANETLTSWIRDASSALIAIIDHVANLRSTLAKVRLSKGKNELIKSFRQNAIDLEEVLFHREHRWVQQQVNEAFRSLVYAGTAGSQMPSPRTFEETMLLPSVINRASVFRSYFEQVFSPFGAHRAREKFASDVGDIMHAQYLPYCDVYRCDAFASTYLNKPAKRVGTHLIPSHHELQVAIESQLKIHDWSKGGRAVE